MVLALMLLFRCQFSSGSLQKDMSRKGLKYYGVELIGIDQVEKESGNKFYSSKKLFK